MPKPCSRTRALGFKANSETIATFRKIHTVQIYDRIYGSKAIDSDQPNSGSLYSLFSSLYVFFDMTRNDKSATLRTPSPCVAHTAPASAENCAQPATSGTRPLAVASSLIFMLLSVLILYYLPSNLYSPSPLSILCPLIFII